MANQPRTPVRSIRIPDELWEESKVIADEEGYDGVSEMIREDLEKRRADRQARLDAARNV